MATPRTLPPYAVRVGDLVLPWRVGGHPALDFCNTRALWDLRVREWESVPEQRAEWLRSYDHLAEWAGFVGLLDAAAVRRLRRASAANPQAAGRVLRRARRFREALYHAVRRPGDRAAFDEVAHEAERANAVRRLVFGAGAPARWQPGDGDELAAPLHAVALAGADLLCDGDRDLVRVCPGDECGWLFLDRRGRRRWCSMSTCGNRAKVRAHAARSRGAPGRFERPGRGDQ